MLKNPSTGKYIYSSNGNVTNGKMHDDYKFRIMWKTTVVEKFKALSPHFAGGT
jgi:hypothetical protein